MSRFTPLIGNIFLYSKYQLIIDRTGATMICNHDLLITLLHKNISPSSQGYFFILSISSRYIHQGVNN
jgi:hypothetical protein